MKRFNIGITPIVEGIHVIIYDKELKTEKVNSGEMVSMTKWISKNTTLSDSIAVVHKVEMVSIKFRLFKQLKEEFGKLLKYRIWVKKKTIRIPDKYDYPELQSDFFNVLSDHKDFCFKEFKSDYMINAFGNINVPVVATFEPIKDIIKNTFKRDTKIPESYPGNGLNSNYHIINRTNKKI